MNLEQAIRDAIEKGEYLGGKSFASYRASSRQIVYEIEDNVIPKLTKSISDIMLDPAFWQALGRARMWGKRVTYYNDFLTGKECDDTWRIEWHRLIDHIAAGKDIESFFAHSQI